ncbi:hypothetical protein [Endozoicomonas sp. 4G]|uniref:hypothetical protein n=1 Tax=Endozoicomonas sp. 4G TaxID=2872754 RepID=UPI0020788918|nr:hypothetical protein [Endozoicomonas sp. 4G]
MFKIKSLLSNFSHHSGSYLFLSACLIFSLSSGTAYSAPPIKNSAGSVVFSGEAPELPSTEELGATGITTSDLAENATELNAPVAGAGLGATWSVTLPSSESTSWSTETTDLTPSVANGASNAPLSDQEPMLPGYSDSPNEDVDTISDWPEHFAMLLELESDPANDTNDTFPALDLVNPSLQEMEINNDSLNGALLSIKTEPENYTAIDLYYVLWLLAKLNGEQSLMKVLRLNAIILKRFLNHCDFERVDFHKLINDTIPRGALLGALARLRKALSQAHSKHEIAKIMTQFIFNDLYDYIHSEAATEFEEQVYFKWPWAIHLLRFLYELDQISSQLFDGNNYVAPNKIAYARSRAWFFILGQFGHRKLMLQRVYNRAVWRNPYPEQSEDLARFSQQNRDLYSAHRSLTALFTLFLGNLDMAHNMLQRLGKFERSFYPDCCRNVYSIVRWVIVGNLRMFDPPERNRIMQALSLMFSNPFPDPSLHHTPDTIRSASDPFVLMALEHYLPQFKSE